jgi:Raf kinase inhibitor-like YbhB/YbcL family protein
MRLISISRVIARIPGIILFVSLGAVSSAGAEPPLVLSSSAFKNGAAIPPRWTCSGLNQSPPLQWTGIPHGSRSLALIVEDPDAPMGTFTHWVAYNISPARSGLPEGVPASETPGYAEEGINGRSELGYTGPCPPPGKPHHYHFRLFALDEELSLKSGATAEQLGAAMKGHILGSTELIGIFQR